MEKNSLKLNNKNLTQNNIEKIKQSIDCLKETINRSNSHLYLNSINEKALIDDNKISQKNNSPFFPQTQRQTYNHQKIKNPLSFNKSYSNMNKKSVFSPPKKLNNISFYNINITNNNEKKNLDSIGSLYNSELSKANNYNKTTDHCKIRRNSSINKVVSNYNTSNDIYQINQDKIKNTIIDLEKINKELKDRYKNIIQKYKSLSTKNNLIIKQKSEMEIKIKTIKILNLKMKNRIGNLRKKEINEDFLKNKKDFEEKNKELKTEITLKDEIILNLKNKINITINEDDNLKNINEINKVNSIIEELKNKINQIKGEISKQEEIKKSESKNIL